jgi:hypothetical protein
MATVLWRNFVPLSSYDTASNNNDFVASTIYFDGTTAYPTMGGFWSGVAPRESASFSENPPFVSTLGSSPGFLHIVPGSNTQLESGGVTVSGITDDFDGDVRGGTPDVGADEFTGTNVDLTAPAVAYTFLGRDVVPPVTSRSFNSTATDATGVAIGPGVRPRVYYKKSTDPNDLTGWKYTEAAGAGGSPFSFTIDYTLLNAGGVTSGDVIQYFVVAQDTATTPNVGIYQGTFRRDAFERRADRGCVPDRRHDQQLLDPSRFTARRPCARRLHLHVADQPGRLVRKPSTRTSSRGTTSSRSSATPRPRRAPTPSTCGSRIPPPATTRSRSRAGGGAARTVSGSVAGALIRLHGADRVTFDGLNSGGNSLTVSNTSTRTRRPRSR